MKKLTFYIICMVASLNILAQSEHQYYQDAFEQANELYKQGDYEKAIEQYQVITGAGYEAVKVYYNLGNCYFKQEQIPEAILNYEKALQLNPGDPDILFNLELANGKIVDKIEPVPELFLVSWWKSFVNLASSNSWSVLFLVSSLILACAIGLFVLAANTTIKRVAFILSLFSISFSMLSFVAGQQQKNMLSEQNSAIVFAPNITVRSEPAENATKLFIIHEGLKVKMLEQSGNWHRIELLDGNVGWVQSDALVPI